MKRTIVSPENPNGIVVDLTSEEIAKNEAEAVENAQETETLQAEAQAKEELKASAKAKLVAGTPLTEDEANTIVL